MVRIRFTSPLWSRESVASVPRFLGVEELVTVLDRPASEGFHRAVEALPQAGQVLDARWRFGFGAAVDQAVGEQAVQGVG